MIYYKRENGYIVKYEVTYDEEKLMEVRNEIVDNCSLVTVESEITHNISVNKFETYERRSVSKKLVNIEDKDSNQIMYEISYEKYLYPSIVRYLDQILLYNDVDALRKIIKKEDMSDNTLYVDASVKLIKNFEEISSDDIALKHSALEELVEFSKNSINNHDKKPVLYDYYRKARDLFQFNEIERRRTSEVDDILTFMDIDQKSLIKKLRSY